MDMEPEHTALIGKLEVFKDPLIPVQPDLEQLFYLNKCCFRVYAFPLGAFNAECKSLANDFNFINDTCEPRKFIEFYNQIQLEREKRSVLNSFFLNGYYFDFLKPFLNNFKFHSFCV